MVTTPKFEQLVTTERSNRIDAFSWSHSNWRDKVRLNNILPKARSQCNVHTFLFLMLLETSFYLFIFLRFCDSSEKPSWTLWNADRLNSNRKSKAIEWVIHSITLLSDLFLLFCLILPKAMINWIFGVLISNLYSSRYLIISI